MFRMPLYLRVVLKTPWTGSQSNCQAPFECSSEVKLCPNDEMFVGRKIGLLWLDVIISQNCEMKQAFSQPGSKE